MAQNSLLPHRFHDHESKTKLLRSGFRIFLTGQHNSAIKKRESIANKLLRLVIVSLVICTLYCLKQHALNWRVVPIENNLRDLEEQVVDIRNFIKRQKQIEKILETDEVVSLQSLTAERLNQIFNVKNKD